MDQRPRPGHLGAWLDARRAPRLFYTPDPRYFTAWSAAALGCALLAYAITPRHRRPALRALVLAAVVNSAVVGCMGPAVNAFGQVPGSSRALHVTNFWYHALPAAAAWIARQHLGPTAPAEQRRALHLLALLDAAWLAWPLRDGRWGWSKARHLYGIEYASWFLGVPAAQALVWRLLR